MATTQASVTHDQHQSPIATPQTPQGLLSGQRQPAQGSESSPSLHRYLGNSYAQAMAATQQRPGLQTKLAVNEPGDLYEQEADRMAEQVMAMPTHSNIHSASLQIQRLSGALHGQTDVAPASVHQALTSPGRPLEPALRQGMEQRFGHDFSAVRVHTDAAAEQSARDVHAHAYTLGHDIVFAAGQFAPGTRDGQRLIAHELTHVLQQQGTTNLIQRQPTLPTEDTPSKDIPGASPRVSIPLQAPIKDHIETLAQLDNDIVIQIIQQTGEDVKEEPAYLILTLGGIAYAYVGDDAPATKPKVLPIKEGVRLPELGVYMPVRSGAVGSYPAAKQHVPLRLTSQGFLPYSFSATIRNSEWFDAETWAQLRQLWGKAARLYIMVVPDPPPEPDEEKKPAQEAQVHDWAQSQYSRVMRRLEGSVKAKQDGTEAPSGTGTGKAGEGRGGEARPRDRAKSDKVAYYVGKHGPTLNVWKGKSHEAIPLKPGESDTDLIRRIEEAAARQQSTGQRISDGATVTGFVGGQGGRQATDEEMAEATAFTANAPAYPSRMDMQGGSSAEVSPNGWGSTITGARHNFDMILDWDAVNFGRANQVLARLGWVDYYWQVIDISKLDLGGESKVQEEFEPEDDYRQRLRRQARLGAQDSAKVRQATRLEGFNDKVSDTASISWEGAKKDAPDIVAADSLVTWPVKAAQLSIIAVDMAWSVGKALIGAWVAKMTEPENRREIDFGQPGEFLIRCLANPQPNEDKPDDQRTRRATSIAVFPVRVVSASARAQEVTRQDQSQLEQAQMLVAALQKELDVDPHNAWLQNRIEMAQLVLGNQRAAYGWSTVEKVGHELESYDKQIAVLEKLKNRNSSIANLKGEEKTIALDLKEEIAKRLKRGPKGFVAWYDYEFHLHDVKEARKKKAEQKKLTEKKAEAVAPETALRPRVTFVSEENGALVRMEMILGRARGASDQKPQWVLADVTTPDTARSYEGSSPRAGAEGDAEAVTKAFEAFAEKAEYGRGTISIEIPGRQDLIASGKTMLMQPGTAARWRGRLRSLIEIAGLVAPFVRGGQLIGQIAAIGSALDAGEKLYDRAVNDRLKANFETLADVVTVLAPVASGAAALSTRLSPSSSGGYILRVAGKGIDYANDLMLPATFIHDLDQIVRDTSLGDPEKKAAIVMLFGRAMRDGVVQYAAKAKGMRHGGAEPRRIGSHEPAARGGTHEPAAPVAGHTPETPVTAAVRRAVQPAVQMEGGAAPARKPPAHAGGVHKKFDLSDVQGPAAATPAETRPRPTADQPPRPAESDRPPSSAPDMGQQPPTGQEPRAGEAGSTPVSDRIRATREEQARRSEIWRKDAETIELGTRPDARARARAAEFAPVFAQWGALGVSGRKARIQSLINAHLGREGIPPVEVKWGDKPPGSAVFHASEWLMILSERAVSADRISIEDFATLVDNAVHEGRHTVTTFRGVRVALADNNYKPGTVIPDRIRAQADAANHRKSPSAELSAEALGEAREIYEVMFARDQRRAGVGTEGILDRDAVYARKEAAARQYADVKARNDSNVAEVKRLEAEDRHGSDEHVEAQRKVAESSEALRRAEREYTTAHNEYVALPEEIASWRMGSSVKAAVLERLALQTRLTDLRQQQRQAMFEQRQKRQSGDRKGAAEALEKSREAERHIRDTQAEIDALLSQEPQLVGGRVARQNQPLTSDEIAHAPNAPETTRDPAERATPENAAMPPMASTPKPPDITDSDARASTLDTPRPAETAQSESKPPALAPGQQSHARQHWEQALRETLQKGGGQVGTGLVTVSDVQFLFPYVTRAGRELQVSYLVIKKVAGPKGAGMEVHDALEQAAVQIAQQTEASAARITVDQVGNPHVREELQKRGYAEVANHADKDQRSWTKLIPITPSSPGTDVPPTVPTDRTPPGLEPHSLSTLTNLTPPSGTPKPVATPEGHANEPTHPDSQPLPPGADNEPTAPDIRQLPPEAEPPAPDIQELPAGDDTLVDLPLGEVDENDPTPVEIQLPGSTTITAFPPPMPRPAPGAEPPVPDIQELPAGDDTLVDLPLGEVNANDLTPVEIRLDELPGSATIKTSPPPMPGPAPARRPSRPAPPSPAPGRAQTVPESEVIASYNREPSSIRPQGPGQHQDLWQAWGGAGQQAPLAYRDPDGVIRVNIEDWLSQPRPSIGVQLRPGAAAPPWAAPPPAGRPAPTPANRALGVADTGQAPAPVPQQRALSADPLAQTPAAPVPVPPPARPTPAPKQRPGPPTAAALQRPMPRAANPRAFHMHPQLPPQAVSLDRVQAIAQSGAARIGYSVDSARHREAWQLLGGRLNPGEDPPVAFLSDDTVYVDRSRWPSARPLPRQ